MDEEAKPARRRKPRNRVPRDIIRATQLYAARQWRAHPPKTRKEWQSLREANLPRPLHRKYYIKAIYALARITLPPETILLFNIGKWQPYGRDERRATYWLSQTRL